MILGDVVTKSDLADGIYQLLRPLAPPVPVYSPYSGCVGCECVPALCQTGDCLFHLGF